MNLAFPYGFDRSGRTASASQPQHLSDLIGQVLLTAPGERVNRPTFGSGTGQLVFAPASDTLAAAQQQLIQAALQQWLSDLVRVQSVQVSTSGGQMTLTVAYTTVQTNQPATAQFVYGSVTP
jgi:phage baseplate assembly protein W